MQENTNLKKPIPIQVISTKAEEVPSTLGYPYKWQIWSIIVPIQGTSDMHERILKIPLEFL